VIVLDGGYYDGRTSRRRAARLAVYDDGQVRLEAVEPKGELLGTWPLEALSVPARVADTPRSVELPGGGRFETADNDALDRVSERLAPGPWAHLLHRLESRGALVAAAVVLVVAAGWAFAVHGIPALARAAAFALPASTSRSLGEGALETLDRTTLRPTELGAAERERAEALFAEVAGAAPDGEAFAYRLVFRGGGRLGANALALPSGTVVVTDELHALVRAEGELVAVLAHEVGHLVHRHALRQALQASLVAVAVILVTGDVSATSSVVAAIPTVLAEARFSRAFEREADAYALGHLQRAGIDPSHFAALLRRLDPPGAEGPVEGFLATHPGTEERIRRFERAGAPESAGRGAGAQNEDAARMRIGVSGIRSTRR